MGQQKNEKECNLIFSYFKVCNSNVNLLLK